MQTADGAAKALAAMAELRAVLLQPKNMNLFIAADLTKLPSPSATLANAILPPPTSSGAADSAAASPAAPAAGPFDTVSERHILSGRSGQATICALSAIETHFVQARAPGVAEYSPDHAPLLVAIEYLTALEGDFWVKLRG